MKSLMCAGMLTLLATAPCFAMTSWFPDSGKKGGGSVSHSAPGPMLGVGIPALVAAGGYVWYRRRSKERRK
jgi:hypothetical protein